MAATKFFAAIDESNSHGAVYGIGTSEAAARSDARAHAGRISEVEAAEYQSTLRVVPCTDLAAAHAKAHGGAPSPLLTVSRDGVCLRSEEE